MAYVDFPDLIESFCMKNNAPVPLMAFKRSTAHTFLTSDVLLVVSR